MQGVEHFNSRGGGRLQPGSKKAALVLGLLSHIYGLDEMHVQHAALQNLDGLRILRVHSMTGLPARPFGAFYCRPQLLTSKCVVSQLQQHVSLSSCRVLMCEACRSETALRNWTAGCGAWRLLLPPSALSPKCMAGQLQERSSTHSARATTLC